MYKRVAILGTAVCALAACFHTPTLPTIQSLGEEDFTEFTNVIENVRCSVGLYLASTQPFETDLANQEFDNLFKNFESESSDLFEKDGVNLVIKDEAARTFRRFVFSDFKVIFTLSGVVAETASTKFGLQVPIGSVTVGPSTSGSSQSKTTTTLQLTASVDRLDEIDGQSGGFHLGSPVQIQELCKSVRGAREDQQDYTVENDPLGQTLLQFERAIFNSEPSLPAFDPEKLQLINAFQVTRTAEGGFSLSLLVVSFGSQVSTSQAVSQQVTFVATIDGSRVGPFLFEKFNESIDDFKLLQ